MSWSRADAAHLLRRAGFGAYGPEIEEACQRGREAAVAALFAPRGHDPAIEGGIAALLPTASLDALQSWWMALVFGGGDPLREKVTLFWHDHFATSFDKVDDVRLMHRQNALFRELGLGDFRELLLAVSKDPAMLVWLDGDRNRRGHPNENFAREVLELFTLGIGNYTERDVQEAARAFTGWGTRGRSFLARPADHDDGEKTILGVTGRFDGEQALARIVEHPACVRHVSRRLIEEFVGPLRGGAAGERQVDELAAVLAGNGWRIDRTLAHLFRSPAFYAERARRTKVASPVELVCGTVRTLQARLSPRLAAEAAARMGQSLFRPPSVKGWDGGAAWINATTWIERHNMMSRLAFGEVGQVDLRAAFGAPNAKADVPGAVCGVLLPDGIEQRFGATLGQAAREAETLEEALASVTMLVLTSPEYQLT